MTDTPRRSMAKALTWQISGLAVMMSITWIVTGSLATGSMIAVLGALSGLVTYVLHERAWARIGWGRRA